MACACYYVQLCRTIHILNNQLYINIRQPPILTNKLVTFDYINYNCSSSQIKQLVELSFTSKQSNFGYTWKQSRSAKFGPIGTIYFYLSNAKWRLGNTVRTGTCCIVSSAHLVQKCYSFKRIPVWAFGTLDFLPFSVFF